MMSRRALAVVALLGFALNAPQSRAGGPRARPRRLPPATASGGDPPVEDQACLAAFRGAEMQRQSGHLRAAKDRFLVCAQTACGAVIARQCTAQLAALEPELPSVIPLVNDESGEARADVSVAIDGEPLTSRIDGRAFSVDPGFHRFTFTAKGEVIARQNVMIVQGQHDRPLQVSFKAGGAGSRGQTSREIVGTSGPAVSAKAARKPTLVMEGQEAAVRSGPPRSDRNAATSKLGRGALALREDAADQQRGRSTGATAATPAETLTMKQAPAGEGRRWLVYGLAAGGLSAVAAGAVLTYWGRVDNDRLSECSPACSSSDVSHIRRLYLGADVAFGVGGAALLGATWAYWRQRSVDGQARRAAVEPDVRPVTVGAVAGLRGQF